MSAEHARAEDAKPTADIPTLPFTDGRGDTLAYRCFHDEKTDLPGLTALIQEELSEP